MLSNGHLLLVIRRLMWNSETAFYLLFYALQITNATDAAEVAPLIASLGRASRTLSNPVDCAQLGPANGVEYWSVGLDDFRRMLYQERANVPLLLFFENCSFGRFVQDTSHKKAADDAPCRMLAMLQPLMQEPVQTGAALNALQAKEFAEAIFKGPLVLAAMIVGVVVFGIAKAVGSL